MAEIPYYFSHTCALILKMWSLNQEPRPILGPILDLLNEKPREWGPTMLLTSPLVILMQAKI